jgi:hypothetical protein
MKVESLGGETQQEHVWSVEYKTTVGKSWAVIYYKMDLLRLCYPTDQMIITGHILLSRKLGGHSSRSLRRWDRGFESKLWDGYFVFVCVYSVFVLSCVAALRRADNSSKEFYLCEKMNTEFNKSPGLWMGWKKLGLSQHRRRWNMIQISWCLMWIIILGIAASLFYSTW